ncbi:MAG: glycosyltransferase family 4 protein [Lentisphaerae bacterium]|jgi:glycosyltransferase involved in cell wall biosynthesis|nr:glycosyltransferase family 4 protein [Lentisphaerota bacterium]
MTSATTPRIDVLHVTEAGGGGVARHLGLVLPALSQRGLTCGLFAFGQRLEDGFRALAEEQSAAGRLSALAFAPGANLLTATMRLRKLVQQWQPRILHLHATRAGLAGRLALRRNRPPAIVYSPHAFGLTPNHTGQQLALKFGEQRLAGWTDCYALVSHAEYDDAMLLGLPANQCLVCENGLPDDFTETLLDRTEARKRLHVPPDSIVLGVPCRLAKQKNLDCLIKALAALRRTPSGLPPNFRILLYGTGPEEQALRQLVLNEKLTAVVHFAGLMPNLHRLLRGFDLAAIPSRYEGLSYALLETLAAEVPLLVSGIPANLPRPELHECLWTFQVGDEQDLARQLAAALQSQDERRRRAQLGAVLVKKNFRLNVQIDCLTALYQRLGNGDSH